MPATPYRSVHICPNTFSHAAPAGNATRHGSIETLSNAETIQYLGVRGQDISESVSESMQVPEGVYVESVEEDSPAMKAGLQSGDVIQELDGEEAKTMQQYSTLLQNCKEGQKIRLTLMRSKGAEGYAQMTVEAEVQSR